MLQYLILFTTCVIIPSNAPLLNNNNISISEFVCIQDISTYQFLYPQLTNQETSAMQNHSTTNTPEDSSDLQLIKLADDITEDSSAINNTQQPRFRFVGQLERNNTYKNALMRYDSNNPHIDYEKYLFDIFKTRISHKKFQWSRILHFYENAQPYNLELILSRKYRVGRMQYIDNLSQIKILPQFLPLFSICYHTAQLLVAYEKRYLPINKQEELSASPNWHNISSNTSIMDTQEKMIAIINMNHQRPKPYLPIKIEFDATEWIFCDWQTVYPIDISNNSIAEIFRQIIDKTASQDYESLFHKLENELINLKILIITIRLLKHAHELKDFLLYISINYSSFTCEFKENGLISIEQLLRHTPQSYFYIKP